MTSTAKASTFKALSDERNEPLIGRVGTELRCLTLHILYNFQLECAIIYGKEILGFRHWYLYPEKNRLIRIHLGCSVLLTAQTMHECHRSSCLAK